MGTIFTETDIIRFIYDETSVEETKQIKDELRKNLVLKSFYEKFQQTLKDLDKLEFEPDPTSVNIVLDYSASQHSRLEHQ